MPDSTTPILVAEQLTKSFVSGKRRVVALDGVSFAIAPGVITGLIGPDGAGKTTLMRLAAGLLVPDAGTICAFGRDATKETSAVLAETGYMPQRFGLYEDLSVRENLDLYADLQGVAKALRPERYAELMRMTGLHAFEERLAGRLSGGMKQKLGLSCALVRPPRLLLLDEPTVGVDPVSRRELWTILGRLVDETGMSVLLSTAYLDEAERCREVVLLHEGRVLDQGAPQAMSARLSGRAWSVAAPRVSRRLLQMKLARVPGVVDALAQGEQVRVLTRDGVFPEAARSLPEMAGGAITPLAPRFEDAFVLRLQEAEARESCQSRLLLAEERSGEKTEEAPRPVVIRVSGLTRRFGDFLAVDGIGFEVARGEIFGLLGANGAGKSTTFRMLCGLLPASGGQLEVAGHDLRRAAATARERIGYMSQKFSQYANLSVAQNLAFFASAYGLSGPRRAERLAWAEAEFDLALWREHLAGDLSLGYKQRLAMACALMHSPDILFLDEPTSGVDPLARREFWQRINTLALSGVTILITTHFMEEAEYCDRLAILSAGRILAEGEPDAIKEAARTPEQERPGMEEAFIQLVKASSPRP